MTTTKPLRRHPALVSFSKDHHFGLLLIWKIRQGIRKAIENKRIIDYVVFFFKEDLRNHFREEEETIFILLAPTDVYRKKAEAEHQLIYELVKTLEVPGADEVLLSQFADLLESHIRFEERTLFNHLQKVTEEHVLEAVLTANDRPHEDVDLRWQDKFWE